MLKTIRALAISLGALAALTGPPAAAQQFPTRPIRWIVPLPPGATADIITRLVAQRLGESLG